MRKVHPARAIPRTTFLSVLRANRTLAISSIKGLTDLDPSVCLDASRPWPYWMVHGLDLLDALHLPHRHGPGSRAQEGRGGCQLHGSDWLGAPQAPQSSESTERVASSLRQCQHPVREASVAATSSLRTVRPAHAAVLALLAVGGAEARRVGAATAAKTTAAGVSAKISRFRNSRMKPLIVQSFMLGFFL